MSRTPAKSTAMSLVIDEEVDLGDRVVDGRWTYRFRIRVYMAAQMPPVVVFAPLGTHDTAANVSWVAGRLAQYTWEALLHCPSVPIDGCVQAVPVSPLFYAIELLPHHLKRAVRVYYQTFGRVVGRRIRFFKPDFEPIPPFHIGLITGDTTLNAEIGY